MTEVICLFALVLDCFYRFCWLLPSDFSSFDLGLKGSNFFLIYHALHENRGCLCLLEYAILVHGVFMVFYVLRVSGFIWVVLHYWGFSSGNDWFGKLLIFMDEVSWGLPRFCCCSPLTPTSFLFHGWPLPLFLFSYLGPHLCMVVLEHVNFILFSILGPLSLDWKLFKS